LDASSFVDSDRRDRHPKELGAAGGVSDHFEFLHTTIERPGEKMPTCRVGYFIPQSFRQVFEKLGGAPGLELGTAD
jgi:hypothetical protein